ncbi:MAG: hypothetical protein NC114_10880 [Ruminococcus flavefaciens]|nr:hypothetical protein [Ruminococcus flavefaciens]
MEKYLPDETLEREGVRQNTIAIQQFPVYIERIYTVSGLPVSELNDIPLPTLEQEYVPLSAAFILDFVGKAKRVGAYHPGITLHVIDDASL